MLAPGTVLFDKYVVDREIGQGGMASVFAATHLHLHEAVAIKVLLPEFAQNPTVVQRFLREARAAARLKGEHVTRVIDVGLLPWGPPYMVMELLVGMDLAELLKHHKLLSPPEAVDCVLQACEALAEAHASGIVHRDIKPSNLYITRRPDGSPLVKVLDFGISKVGFEDQITNLTLDSVVGTPSYMSPEQLRGSHAVDARTDIWSLGIVLFRLLAGVRPFAADSISALAIQAATEPTPQIRELAVPPDLAAIVYRCLEKDASQRFQSVAELAYALAPFAADQRAAGMVIERTQSILRWTPPSQRVVQQAQHIPQQYPIYQAPVHGTPKEPTTLGSSAGVMYASPPSRRRGWVIGSVAAVLIGSSLAIITVVGNKTSNQADSPTPAASTAPAPTVEPLDVGKPDVAKPDVAKPEVAKPEVDVAKPEVAKPEVDVAKPEVAKPEVAKPDVETKHEVKIATSKTKADKPKLETKADKSKLETKPDKSKPETKADASKDTKADAKPDTKADAKPETKPETQPKSNPLDTRM